jgi:hypothetical protein
VFALGIAGAQLCGCATLPRQSYSEEDQVRATIAGYDAIRYWADGPTRELASWMIPERVRKTDRLDVLALSGGGSGGAFAAGLLKGWTASGKRPSFSVVTGVSTGALIAPFAFLGPAYDGQLEKLYRSGIAGNLQRLRDPVNIVSGKGLLDPAPLQDLIAAYATPDLLGRIAAEHRKGRRLFIITTNIDAQRPVAWDIGQIAASAKADSVGLVRQILLASASIPGVYPPVIIKAQGVGTELEEMHVDGAATMQFFMPADALSMSRSVRQRGQVHLWLIVNNTLPPEFAMTPNNTLSVAYRSFATLMKSHAEQNAKIAYGEARKAKIDFNFAFIDRSVDYDPGRPFESEYMDAVFTIGEQGAASGAVWRKNVETLEVSRP